MCGALYGAYSSFYYVYEGKCTHLKKYYKTVTRKEYIPIIPTIDEDVFAGEDEDNDVGQGQL